MKIQKEKPKLRVVAQLTFSPKIISLVAEEDLAPFRKGDIVKKINRNTLGKMQRPLSVEVIRGGAVRPVTA